jgi:PTH1 family peptidyl-tRNA hydrolase
LAQIKLICALGNPGDQYAQTRHNAGFWFLGKLSSAENFGLNLNSRFKSLVSEFRHNGRVVRVIAPQTYMNKSGEALVPFAKFYQVVPEEILVVHDEIDLLPGITKFKTGGGHGGHNGLRDIVRLLGSKDFHAEAQLIDASLDKAIAVTPKILDGDFAAAMNELHVS